MAENCFSGERKAVNVTKTGDACGTYDVKIKQRTPMRSRSLIRDIAKKPRF